MTIPLADRSPMGENIRIVQYTTLYRVENFHVHIPSRITPSQYSYPKRCPRCKVAKTPDSAHAYVWGYFVRSIKVITGKQDKKHERNICTQSLLLLFFVALDLQPTKTLGKKACAEWRSWSTQWAEGIAAVANVAFVQLPKCALLVVRAA
jgi:hypothetical protein